MKKVEFSNIRASREYIANPNLDKVHSTIKKSKNSKQKQNKKIIDLDNGYSKIVSITQCMIDKQGRK
ncbi:MAG: hypothetical protein M0Q88_00135 [Bacilli bacterium]|nr:hypothetical protein [Bacilli bacterium]